MGGSGIDQAKQAISSLLTEVDGHNNEISIITYDTNATVYDLSDKNLADKLNIVKTFRANGGTDFACAFKAITDLKLYKRGGQSEVAIIFFTDGQDGYSSGRETVIKTMTQALQQNTLGFEFHTIGFTSSHDVKLLTEITRLGSVQGTFQYCESSNTIVSSIENLIGLVKTDAKAGCLIIKDENGNELKNIKVSFSKQANDEYIATIFIDKSNIPKDYKTTMQLKEEIFEITPSERHDITEDDPLFVKLVIKFIEKSLLDFSGQISLGSNKELLNNIFEKGKQLQEKLAKITCSIQRMKNRVLRRELYTFRNTIHDTLVGFNEILSSAMIGSFSNDKLATLNTIAYRSVTDQCLKKKLDMRKQENVSIFKESEHMIEEAVSVMNFEELKNIYKSDIEKYGNCVLSCQNWLELVQDRDCLCITLDVQRPEKAIRDPSLVGVKSIGTTMMSAESFLDSVLFSLGNTFDQLSVHGGFTGESGTVITGTSRENISGVMPLYINEYHWKVAKEKMKSILGYMTTLEPMGYMETQLEVIPFLVLARAASAFCASKSEFSKFQFVTVLDTCAHIYKDLKESVASKVLGYNDNLVSRLPDSIPNNNVFIAKVLCAIKIGELTHDSIDWSNFIKNIVEEELRRIGLEKDALSEDELNDLLGGSSLINPFVDEFIKKLMERQKNGKQANIYAQKIVALLESNTEPVIIGESKPKNEFNPEYIDNSDLDIYDGSIQNLPSNLITQMDDIVTNDVFPLVFGVKYLLQLDMPLDDLNSLIPHNEGKACLLIQTILHKGNSKRRAAFENGSYHSPLDIKVCRSFIKETITPIVKKKRKLKLSSLLSKEVSSFHEESILFVNTMDLNEAAGIIYGIHRGGRTKSFHILKQTLEKSTNVPMVREKVTMLLTGFYKTIQVVQDSDGASWQPQRTFCFRIWNNNRDAFGGVEDLVSFFGEKHRVFFASVTALKKFQ